MNVNASATPVLHAFLTAVRWRLWAMRSQVYARSLLWQIALLLSILAGIHHFMVQVPRSISWLGVMILVLLMLVRCVRNRPTLTASAAAADREFGGRALLMTAVECWRQSNPNEAAKIVLQQASDAARSWGPGVSTHFRRPRATATTLAIVPLFAGLVLLSLAGKDSDGRLAGADAVGRAGIDSNPLGQSNTDTDEIATLRTPPVAGDLPDQSEADAGQRVAAITELTPRQATDPDVVTDRIALPDAPGAGAGTAAASADDSGLPGQALANPDLPARDAQSRFTRRELVELQRTGEIVAAGENRNATFSDIEKPHRKLPLDVLAASAPETRAHWTSLTAAQAAYANRYLNETGNAND